MYFNNLDDNLRFIQKKYCKFDDMNLYTDFKTIKKACAYLYLNRTLQDMYVQCICVYRFDFTVVVRVNIFF